ncbi:uncharacterized protein METZ01_LOCUS417165, partial [marine metagenome]
LLADAEACKISGNWTFCYPEFVAVVYAKIICPLAQDLFCEPEQARGC